MAAISLLSVRATRPKSLLGRNAVSQVVVKRNAGLERRFHRLAWRIADRFPWQWRSALAAQRQIELALPEFPNEMLEAACKRQDSRMPDAPDPFWAQVWDSAAGLDAFLDRVDLDGQRVLEIGCGAGLVGLSALLRGARVTLTDGATEPLLLIQLSLLRLGLKSYVRRLRFGIDVLPGQKFSLILGSDITYNRQSWPSLVGTLISHLDLGGIVLLSDPYRSVSTEFAEWVTSHDGWDLQIFDQPTGLAKVRVMHLSRPTRVSRSAS